MWDSLQRPLHTVTTKPLCGRESKAQEEMEIVRATTPAGIPIFTYKGPKSGDAIPIPPDAEPQIPAKIVVAIARERSFGPGMFIIASTTLWKHGAALTTAPNATTADVLQIALREDLQLSPTWNISLLGF